MTVLRVDVRAPVEAIRIADRCLIEVAVVNEGPEAAVVNSRLAIGYRNSQHRELFVEIFRVDSSELVGGETQLYDRARATAADYTTVPAGDSVRTSFDLFEWYSVPGPGRYELVVTYQADEPLARPPAGTLGGAHSSQRTALLVDG